MQTADDNASMRAMLREEMQIAVAKGISEAMTDEAAERFWNKGIEVLQRQATERTGRWVLGGLTSMAKRAAWIAVFALMVYSVGGWALLKTVWAAISPKT